MNSTMNDVLNQMEKCDDRRKIEMALAFKLFMILEAKNIIRMHSDYSVSGYSKQKISLTELDSLLADTYTSPKKT